MVRQTSLDAYNYIQQSGVLSERRKQIYNILFKYGPMTGGEALEKMEEEYGYRPYSSSHGRFAELRDMGVVQELGIRECSVTGRNVILWDVTSNFPTEIVKKPTNKEIIKKLNSEIDAIHLIILRSVDFLEKDRFNEALSLLKSSFKEVSNE